LVFIPSRRISNENFSEIFSISPVELFEIPLLGILLNYSTTTPKRKTAELETLFQFTAGSRAIRLTSSKLIIILENRDYMGMLKEKLAEIKWFYGNLRLGRY
jgi:hypothetical protein